MFNKISLPKWATDSIKKQVATKTDKNEFAGKSQAQIVEEIHETFFTEVDRLLAGAKIMKTIETDKQALIDKCERLKKLGFTATQEVKEAEAEIWRMHNLESENLRNNNLAEMINYFSFRYPNYKFITEESVKKICEKYGLVYGPIDRYTGTVPDKNIQHIEDFKVMEEDECHIKETLYRSMSLGERSLGKYYTSEKQWREAFEAKKKREEEDRAHFSNFHAMHMPIYNSSSERIVDMKCPLEIAAPQKDFNLSGMEIADGKVVAVVDKDPIVLKPVIYNNQKHYLIVTAWGLEASDPEVVNANHN